MSKYLTVKEVAALLGRSSKFIYKKKEQIPGFFMLAGNIFFDKEVLLKRLEQLAKRPRGGDNHHSL